MELGFLTPELRRALEALPEKRRRQVQELRLRTGAPAKLVLPWGEELLMGPSGLIYVTDRLLGSFWTGPPAFPPTPSGARSPGCICPWRAAAGWASAGRRPCRMDA